MKLTTLPIYHNTSDHRLPIYSFIYFNSYLITCSQNQINFYFIEIENNKMSKFTLFQKMNISGNILCSISSDDLLYFGVDSSIIYIIKYNNNTSSFVCIHQILIGTLDIICMKIFNKYLIAGGLDGILNIINISTNQLIRKININEVINYLDIKKVNKLIDENVIYGLNIFNDQLIVFTINRFYVFNNDFQLIKNNGDMFNGLNNELYFSKSAITDSGSYLLIPLCFLNGEHVVEILNKDFKRVYSLCGHIKTIESVAVSKYVKMKESINNINKADNSFNDTFDTSFLGNIKQINNYEFLIATASQDRTLCIWTSAYEKPLIILKNFTCLPVMHMEFFGIELICSSYDGFMKRLIFDEYEIVNNIEETKQQTSNEGFKNLELIGIKNWSDVNNYKSIDNDYINEKIERSKKKIEEDWEGLDNVFKPFNNTFNDNATISSNHVDKESNHVDKESNQVDKESIQVDKESNHVEINTQTQQKMSKKFKIIAPIQETPKMYKSKKNTFFAIFKNSPTIPSHEISHDSKTAFTSDFNINGGEELIFGDYQIKSTTQSLRVSFLNKELYSIISSYRLLCFNTKYLIIYKDVLKIYKIESGSLLFPFYKFIKIYSLDIYRRELLILLHDSINIINLKSGKVINKIPLTSGVLISCQFDTLYYIIVIFKDEGKFYYNKNTDTWNSLNSSITNSVFSEETYFSSNDICGISETFESLEYEFIKNIDIIKTKKSIYYKIYLIKKIKTIIEKFASLIYKSSVLEIKLVSMVKKYVKYSKKYGFGNEAIDSIAKICAMLESKGIKVTANEVWDVTVDGYNKSVILQ